MFLGEFVEEVASDLSEGDHMGLELAVSAEEVLVNEVKLSQYRYFQIRHDVFHLFPRILEISHDSGLFGLYFLFEVSSVVLLLAQQEEHFLGVQLLLGQHRSRHRSILLRNPGSAG